MWDLLAKGRRDSSRRRKKRNSSKNRPSERLLQWLKF